MPRHGQEPLAFLAIGLALFISSANAGQISDALGMYFPDSNGKCKTSGGGTRQEDVNLRGVCVPASVIMRAMMNQGINMEIVTLGVTEMVSPEMADALKAEVQRKRLPATRAYEVQIDSHNSDIFKLVDGSVLQQTDGRYVGYIGYHEQAILYQDGGQWKLCAKGSIYKVDLLKDGGYHYSRSSISKSIAELEKLSVCS